MRYRNELDEPATLYSSRQGLEHSIVRDEQGPACVKKNLVPARQSLSALFAAPAAVCRPTG
jgi:hypothetical protein